MASFTGIGTTEGRGHYRLPQLPAHCTMSPHDHPRLEVTKVIPSLLTGKLRTLFVKQLFKTQSLLSHKVMVYVASRWTVILEISFSWTQVCGWSKPRLNAIHGGAPSMSRRWSSH